MYNESHCFAMAFFNDRPGNAFAGGVYAPSSTPTGVTGSLGQVGAGGFPQPGAAPILSARNNSGSNVRIPYARLVPMRGKTMRSIMPNSDESELWRRLIDGRAAANEYDGLEGAELAWIHGRAYGSTGSSAGMLGKGVDRMQRLAFTSWLESFFYARFANKIINLNMINLDQVSGSALIDEYKRLLANKQRAVTPEGQVPDPAPPLGNAMNTNDVLSSLSGEGSLPCGIFTLEKGPFLRGKVNDDSMKKVKTFDASGREHETEIPNNVADLLAFQGLYQEMEKEGLFEWTPDGMVLSKLESPAGDPIGSAEMDAREAQLFNVAVQGPAIAKTWTGDSKMQCLPMDKVFIVIEADVITGPDDTDYRGDRDLFAKAVEQYITSIKGFTDEMRNQVKRIEADIEERLFGFNTEEEKKRGFDEDLWDNEANRRKNGTVQINAFMTNFRLRRMTSSYMNMYSAFKKGAPSSRCGLGDKIGIRGDRAAARYIVGGWCIGTVLDSAASRASVGNQIRTVPGSMALNINVNVEWWSGDKLHRHYMDVDGNVLGRQDIINGPKKYLAVNVKETRGRGLAAISDRDEAGFGDDFPTSIEAKRRSKSAIDDMDVDA